MGDGDAERSHPRTVSGEIAALPHCACGASLSLASPLRARATPRRRPNGARNLLLLSSRFEWALAARNSQAGALGLAMHREALLATAERTPGGRQAALAGRSPD